MRVNSHVERIKWCLNEQTNVYAYKLALIKEISETRMDEKIETILAKFREKWPYQPIDYYKDKQNGIKKLANILSSSIPKRSGGADDTTTKLLNMDLSLIRNRTTIGEDQPVLSARGRRASHRASISEGMNSSKSPKKLMYFTAVSPDNKPFELLKQSLLKSIHQKIEVPLLFTYIQEFFKFLLKQTDAKQSIVNTTDNNNSKSVSGQNNLSNFGNLLNAINTKKQQQD